jgi:hypothetical protein
MRIGGLLGKELDREVKNDGGTGRRRAFDELL